MSRFTLIFDLDDTIIRSFAAYAKAHQRVAADLGWPVPTERQLVPYAHDWRTTLLGLFPGRDLDAFARRYAEIADEHPYEAIPGALDALTELRGRGHSLWIVTKRDRSRLHSRLAQAGIPAALFDGIFTHEDQPAPKPDPRCFAPVWQALGVTSGAHCAPCPVYVGDREEDFLAARGAELHFVAVQTGPEATLGLPSHMTDGSVIPSIAHFPRWLDDAALSRRS